MNQGSGTVLVWRYGWAQSRIGVVWLELCHGVDAELVLGNIKLQYKANAIVLTGKAQVILVMEANGNPTR